MRNKTEQSEGRQRGRLLPGWVLDRFSGHPRWQTLLFPRSTERQKTNIDPKDSSDAVAAHQAQLNLGYSAELQWYQAFKSLPPQERFTYRELLDYFANHKTGPGIWKFKH